MSEPQRLIESGATGADLLAAARDDAPPAASRRAIAAALGLGTTAATIAGTSATATAATTAGAGATKAVGLSLVAKLTIGAVLMSGVGVGVTRLVKRDDAPAVASSPIAASPSPSVPAPVPVPVPAHEITPPPAARTDEPAAPTEKRTPRALPKATALPATPMPTARASTLADEVKLLDRALFAIRSGDAASALTHLDAYDRTYPRGALGPEAKVARIEAELARGQTERATQLGQAFLAAHPDSPLAKRVHSLIDR